MKRITTSVRECFWLLAQAERDKKIAELRNRIRRYCADLVSYADRLEVFHGEPYNPMRHKIELDYDVTAEALIEAKAELKQLLGEQLTKIEERFIRKGEL